MKEKCINPQIGQMIGRYEFNLLDRDEKRQFELHLLQCDACFQDLYENRPVVHTIQKDIRAFHKAVSDKNVAGKFGELVDSIFGNIEVAIARLFSPLPTPIRIAIPVLAASIILILLLKPDLQNTNPVTPGEQQKITLQDPLEMESKASIDTMRTSSADSETDMLKKISESMHVSLSEDKKYVKFSWHEIIHARSVSIKLIKDGVETQSIINVNSPLKLDIDNFVPGKSYEWEVEMVTADKKSLHVKKPFTLETIGATHF